MNNTLALIPTLKTVIRQLFIGTLFVSGTAMAFQTPTSLYIDDGHLHWNSDAPSINVYENGDYLLTLHDANSYGPLTDGNKYRLAGHDHGMGFTPLSLSIIANDDDDEDDTETEFAEARLYFELNDTDGDLGLHSLVDAASWTTLSIEDLLGNELFLVEVDGVLAAQGMTEIFFESAEPNFEDLNPVDFFARFPAGLYEISGGEFNGSDFESIVTLSHVIPAAPANLMANGESLNVTGGCEEDAGPVVAAPYTINWDPVTYSHAILGAPGAVDVERYQVVLEREEPTAMRIVLDVNPDTTQVVLPQGLINAGDELKLEVLTIAESFNQSASETCFVAAD